MPGETGNIAYQTKAGVAASLIRRAIYAGQFEPGSRLVLRQLQHDFNLSITPIREALQLLQTQGLVTGEPHRGYRVAQLRADDVDEVYWLRGILEPTACEVATPNMDEESIARLRALIASMDEALRDDRSEDLQIANREFHMAIYAAAERPVLLEHINLLWRDSPFGSLRLTPERPAQASIEHTKIADALAAGNAKAAGAAMRVHVESARKSVMQYLATRTSVGAHESPAPD